MQSALRGGPVPLEEGYLDMSVASAGTSIPSGHATDKGDLLAQIGRSSAFGRTC